MLKYLFFYLPVQPVGFIDLSYGVYPGQVFRSRIASACHRHPPKGIPLEPWEKASLRELSLFPFFNTILTIIFYIITFSDYFTQLY